MGDNSYLGLFIVFILLLPLVAVIKVALKEAAAAEPSSPTPLMTRVRTTGSPPIALRTTTTAATPATIPTHR